MDLTTLHFCDDTPYPPVAVDGKNPQYAAAILSNIGSCNSEMSAVSLYFYNSLITREFFQEVAECFHRISLVEMHHLDIFGRLVLLLGGDPRYCSPRQGCPVAWNGNMVTYHASLCEAVQSDISLEQAAIHTYQYQAAAIEDCYISAMLNRIILDEQLHIRAFRRILESCC